MNFQEYQELAARTANNNLSESEAHCNWAMGLTGESGEYSELIKKHVFHGATIDKEKCKSELSDILWYLSNAAKLHGFSLEEIAEYNIDKLKKRYPNGFVDYNKSVR